MPEINNTLDEILEKASQLVEICNLLQEENDSLLSNNQKLEEKIKRTSQKNEALEKQIEVLKLAKSIEGDSVESQNLKQKINEFVSEIDQCILLLKKQ